MNEPILTVLNAASSYDLVDLGTVKDELGITGTTRDAMLQRWITSTSARFSNICGRVFPEENVSEVFRNRYLGLHTHGPRPGPALTLRRRPVTLVSSVSEDTRTLTTSDYEVDYDGGLIYRLTSSARSHWCGTAITAVYSAGYYPIPYDVQDAVMQILKHKWAIFGRDPLLRSFSIENVGAETYWVPLANGGGADLPPDLQPVADTINFYRDLVVA